MPTLEQFLETQNQGVRQNPYKYKIVDIYSVFDASNSNINDDTKIKNAREGILYQNVESIPKNLYNRLVYIVEPGITDLGCLYLRIVII